MINLVVALAAEARPLVRHFGLSQDRDARGFRVYASGEVRLVVTGVGKLNAAAGVAFLGGMDCTSNQAWVNVGVAGQRDFAIGTGVVALRITDHAASCNWYPPRAANLPGVASQVTTFDAPVERYPESTVCDMEASAFFGFATRFSCGELVQCYKVISDNDSTGVAAVEAAMAEELVAGKLGEIGELCSTLEALAQVVSGDDRIGVHLEQYVATWRFTASQRILLREMLRRLTVRGPADKLPARSWGHCRSAGSLLTDIQGYLDALPVRL